MPLHVKCRMRAWWIVFSKLKYTSDKFASHSIISDPCCWPLQANPDPSTCLGVFGLSLYTTERDLREVFSRYGPLAGVNVVYDQRTGRSRGFAFVYFERLEDSKEVSEMFWGFIFQLDTSALPPVSKHSIPVLCSYTVTISGVWLLLFASFLFDQLEDFHPSVVTSSHILFGTLFS